MNTQHHNPHDLHTTLATYSHSQHNFVAVACFMCESYSFFRRIGQLPPNGFEISMAPLKQWTPKLPVSPSATSSLYSPLYLTCTTRSIVHYTLIRTLDFQLHRFCSYSGRTQCLALLGMCHHGADHFTKDSWWPSSDQLHHCPSIQHATLLSVNSAMHSLP